VQAPARRLSPAAGVTWQGGFDRGWNEALYAGMIPGTTLPPRAVALRGDWAAGITTALPKSGTFELIFRPDPNIWDGRYSNNGWLQELPKALTLLTWDNALLISPKTSEQLGVETEDVVTINYAGRSLTAPVFVMPGHPDNCGTIYLGYGRTRAGNVGTKTGVNAYALRTNDAPWYGPGAQVAPNGDSYVLAVTQSHHSMEGRDIVRYGSFAEYQKNPKFTKSPHELLEVISLYPEYKYDGYAWGMAIDLNSCIGCNACTIACQAENNIPVVGKDQVKISREMHWIRVDRYYTGDIDTPQTVFQPLPCMHCEKAPCEPVCPVGATVHSDEGLNDMVYNRCVGTRYCSNNCPYKVRRFNFLKYNDDTTPSLKGMRNPDVTVRSRGVMEKCTYCVQRINSARIEAKKEDRRIADNEVITACAQVCPTDAIVFGDINNPKSRVAGMKLHPLHYGLLSELGTQPRTTYLAKLRNPNPEIEGVA
jgi:molybdopterin-containing oxidoreductase family iron-sulfur binding subunit